MATEMFGKYEIRGKLGAGAMGTVLDAFDPVIERRAALKTVQRPEAGDAEGEEGMARFRREAQAAGRLNHPNIVAVYDYGEDARTAWIAMELVDGGTLKDRLDQSERFPLPEIVRLMEQVLAALDYSHGRGVVHRDIKPANIMLTTDSQVKIADFGIARIENSQMTQVGTIMGTPAYMAPEQLRGETVDSRADIWAAGVVLYQLLTGEKPFAGGYSSVQHKALNTDPTPPSALSVTAPRAFDAVIGRAMAKRPDDRFATAGAFAVALRAAMVAPVPEDGTVVAPAPRPAAAVAVPAMPAGRKGAPVALIAGGSVLLAAGIAAFLVLGRAPDAPPIDPPRPSSAERLATGAGSQAGTTTAGPLLTPGPTGGPAPTSVIGSTPSQVPGPVNTVSGPAASPLGGPSVSPNLTPGPVAIATPSPGPATGPVVAATPPLPPLPSPLLPPAVPRQTPAGQFTIIPLPMPPNAATLDNKPSADTPAQQHAALAPPRPDFRAAAAAATAAAAAQCTLLSIAASDTGLAIEGVLRRGDEVALRRALRDVPAAATRLALREFDGPYCNSFGTLRPILAPPDAAPRLRVVGAMPLLAGQLLRFDVTMPDWAGQLSVTYLMSDGQVAHLTASAPHPPGAIVRLGEPRAGFPGWDVSEPFGSDLMLAIISEGPLFATPRPDVEPREIYMTALAGALSAARAQGRRVLARPMVVETAAR